MIPGIIITFSTFKFEPQECAESDWETIAAGC